MKEELSISISLLYSVIYPFDSRWTLLFPVLAADCLCEMSQQLKEFYICILLYSSPTKFSEFEAAKETHIINRFVKS